LIGIPRVNMFGLFLTAEILKLNRSKPPFLCHSDEELRRNRSSHPPSKLSCDTFADLRQREGV